MKEDDQMRYPSLLLAAILVLLSAVAIAADPEPLDRQSIIDLVMDQTTECRKEKDQSLCSNYFSDDGIIKRVMHEDGARKDGRWFVDDSSRLCILWNGKIKPLCFTVFEQEDGSYNLIKKGKHITTILGAEDGNTKGL
jgi:hypothetical protein